MNTLSSQPVITVPNLTKSYGDFKAPDSVSFAVEKGWVYGYLGSNGAGKAITMRASVGHVDLKTFFLTGAKCALKVNNKEFKVLLLA